MPDWLIPALSGLAGAIVGSGGATYVVRLALTETMRQTFMARADAVSRLDMHEQLGEHRTTQEAKMQDIANAMREEFRSFLVSVREEFEGKFTPTAARLEREHVALRSDLERAIGALDQANRSLREEGKNSAEAVRQASLAQKEVEGLTELYKALSIRLGHVEDAVKEIRHISQAVDGLKEQLEDVLNYQIGEERRRTKEGGR